MFRVIGLCVVLITVLLSNGCALKPHPPSIPMQALSGSRYYSAHRKRLISQALLLSKKRLDYRFGYDNPRDGGMDCSGTIQYLLNRTAHVHAPRDASEMYLWVAREGRIHHVNTYYLHSSQFNRLRPGDLLFWTGTYYTRHKPPITHVMLYLGKNREGVPLMFGAGEGIYQNRIVRGIGVFDFTLPNRHDRAKFVAYGCIPSYTCK